MPDSSPHQQRWDLWNLHTLMPAASLQDLLDLQTASRVQDRRQSLLFTSPGAWPTLAQQAERFLKIHNDLPRGLTLSLHLGPYALAAVPYLQAGHTCHVLINGSSLDQIRPIYEELQQTFPLPGTIHWLSLTEPRLGLRLVRALRLRQPVLAFLDGNDGQGGSKGTLDRGIKYRLPGRNIRVRTGLARLAIRLGCPVDTVLTLWDRHGKLTWVRGPSWTWPRQTDPSQATRTLFDWAFQMITAHPDQWRCWSMLTGVYDSFRQETGRSTRQKQARRRQIIEDQLAFGPDSLRIRWLKEVALWPGDMLEDVTAGCFHAAGGLQSEHLAALQTTPPPTLGQVITQLGRDWLARNLVHLAQHGFLELVPTKRS